MKNTRLQKHLLVASASLALALSVSQAQIVTTNFFFQPTGTNTGITNGTDAGNSGNQFNAVFGGASWQNWYANYGGTGGNGITNYSVSWDPLNPPPSSPTGATIGSVLNHIAWDGVNGGGLSTFICIDGNFWGTPALDGTKYASVDFDMKYDLTSTVSPTNGAHFTVSLDDHLDGGDSGGAFLTNINNNGSTPLFDGNWHHVTIPIPDNVNPFAAVSKGPGYNTFNGGGTSGGFVWWMANVELVGRTNFPPSPKVAFEATANGLNLINDKSPNYTRHQVRTDLNNGDFNVDWVGHATPGTPVTYTFNLAHAPTNNGAGVNFAITPDPASGAGYADPDWSSTNCFYLSINGVNATGVVANITVKTNQAIGNSTAVSIARLTNATPTAAGTWSLTFTNDTDFVLTGPGGVTTNATIPANFLTTPYTGVSIFLSATPNNDSAYNSYADVTTFDVTGVATPIHENFTSGHVTSPFLILQDQTYGTTTSPTGTNTIPNIVFVTTNHFNWFTWTIPDAGFTPVVRSNLSAGTIWTDNPLTNVIFETTGRRILVPKSFVLAQPQTYMGLVQRAFTQLQVILPGETNAPDTVSGKTGTPTPIDLNGGGLETFTVNACDPTWHIIPGIHDNVISTATDPATVPVTNALANGTATVQMVFGTAGTWTITATNASNTNILSNTSSSVVAQ